MKKILILFALLSCGYPSAAFSNGVFAPAYNSQVSADTNATAIYPKVKLAFGADGSATDVTSSSPLPVSATISGGSTVQNSSGALADRSGTAGGTSSQVAAANPTRTYFIFQNTDASNAEWINFGSAATAGSGSFYIPPHASFSFNENFTSTQAVNVIADSGTPGYTAKEH